MTISMRLLPAILGVGFLAEATGNPVADSLVQYGALGLCAFMVWQTYRMIERLGKTNREQSERLDKLHTRTLEAIEKCRK